MDVFVDFNNDMYRLIICKLWIVGFKFLIFYVFKKAIASLWSIGIVFSNRTISIVFSVIRFSVDDSLDFAGKSMDNDV